jgi:hypothetical protein
MRKQGFLIAVITMLKGTIAKNYNVTAIPTTFYVNGQGIIEEIAYGLVDAASLERKFKQLIP